MQQSERPSFEVRPEVDFEQLLEHPRKQELTTW